jgi:hypothetical protein
VLSGPASLTWWQWLLVSGVLGLIAWGFHYNATEDPHGSSLSIVVAVPAGLASIIAFVIGVIRFVKWVWES